MQTETVDKRIIELCIDIRTNPCWELMDDKLIVGLQLEACFDYFFNAATPGRFTRDKQWYVAT